MYYTLCAGKCLLFQSRFQFLYNEKFVLLMPTFFLMEEGDFTHLVFGLKQHCALVGIDRLYSMKFNISAFHVQGQQIILLSVQLVK